MERIKKQKFSFPDPDSSQTMERLPTSTTVEIVQVSDTAIDNHLLVTVYHLFDEMEVTYEFEGEKKTSPVHSKPKATYQIKANNIERKKLEAGRVVTLEVRNGLILRAFRT